MQMRRALSIRTMCLLALGCLLALAADATKLPRILVNPEYGFSVEVPSGAVGCTEGLHGFSILLHPRIGDCGSRAPQDYVGVYGDYNTAFYTKPADVLRALCPHGAVRATSGSDLPPSTGPGMRMTVPPFRLVLCGR
jgi:hypothetical protein